MTYGLTKSQVQHPWNPWGIGILLFLELSFYTLSRLANRDMHLWAIQNSPVSRACYTGSSLCSTYIFVLQGFEVCCLSRWPCPSYLATQRRDKKQRTGVNVWMVADKRWGLAIPFSLAWLYLIKLPFMQTLSRQQRTDSSAYLHGKGAFFFFTFQHQGNKFIPFILWTFTK